MPEVLTICEPTRNRDLALTVQTESMAGLGRGLIPRITAIEGVTRIQASLSTRLHSAGHVWRLNALGARERDALEALKPTGVGSNALLPQDLPIMQCLVRDGRASAADIARELGVHPTTISRRLNRMLATQTLSFRCEMAQLYTEHPVTCQWFAQVPLGEHEQTAAALRSVQNLRLCASTTGSTNFTFVMWLRSVEDIMRIGLEVVERAPGMTLVETSVAVRYAKRMRWLLNDDERATGQVI